MPTFRTIAALFAGLPLLACAQPASEQPGAAQLADCEAMFALARQHYGYSLSNPGPRLRSPERAEIAACAWEENGLAFAERIPDNRFNWVDFSSPVYTAEGAEIQSVRYESNDTRTIIYNCHLNRSSGRWFLGKCVKSLGGIHQGME